MWTCHRCQKPVYFAERKQSIGHDWHPECLKCEECGKVLKPGQHAEHKGAPYCHVPCYGALFGPQLFGHGTKVESHKSFGRLENKLYSGMTRSHLEAAIKLYNNYYEVHGGCGGVKSREVNGRIVLEGVLRLYWGIHSAIRLQENDDELSHTNGPSVHKASANLKQDDTDTENLEDESQGHNSTLAKITGTPGHKPHPAEKEHDSVTKEANGKPKGTEYFAKSYRTNQLRRRPGQRFDKTKLKRRCSINGHVYNRETSVFTPPYGSTMSVWTTSLVNTQEVINMLLEKYRVESSPSNFSLFVVKYNGERKRIRDDEYPLLLRVTQGPDESVAKFFLVERSDSNEVSAAVAQFIHLSEPELQSILRLYYEEEEREAEQIRNKHEEMRRRILKRLDELKVKL